MSAQRNECRFCLKILRHTDKITLIDKDISQQFENVTYIRLNHSTVFSRVICDLCLRSLQMVNSLKDQFIKNQRQLEKECKSQRRDPQEPSRKTASKRKNESSSSNHRQPKTPRLDMHAQEEEEDEDEEEEEGFVKEEQEDPIIKFEPAFVETAYSQTDEEDEDNVSFPDNATDHDDEPGRRYKCFHCDVTFQSTQLRRRHIHVKHMKQRFPCPFEDCDVKIQRQDFFKLHFKRHHKHLSPSEVEEMVEKSKKIKPVYENLGLRTE